MKPTILSVTCSSFLVALSAQDESTTLKKTDESVIKKEQVFRKDGKPAVRSEETLYEIGVLIEYISVEHGIANELIQKFGDHPNDVSELRNRLEEMLDNDEANLIETTWLRSRSGSRAMTESVREYIYPSEFDSAEIPSYVGNSEATLKQESKYEKLHLSSASPGAFNCRNAGTSFEVDAVIGPNQKVVSVNLLPELVTRLGDRNYLREGFEETARGIEHIANPIFYTIKDTTQIDVAPGKFNLLGIHVPHDNPENRILTILRVDLIPIN